MNFFQYENFGFYHSHAFNVATGYDGRSYQNHWHTYGEIIRVDHAISLFPIESLSLTEIAMRAGFQSIPSFNRVFRELKGITPSEYRNMNR